MKNQEKQPNDKIQAYSFLIEDAVKYGTDGAIFLYNLRYWVRFNKANEKPRSRHPDRNGKVRYWSYNSKRAFTQWFPFWTEKQLRRICDNLEKDGAILSGVFNLKKYDQTKWYTLNEKDSLSVCDEKSICPNGQADLPNLADGFGQVVTPIPDLKQKSKTPMIKTSTAMTETIDDSQNHCFLQTDQKEENFNFLDNEFIKDPLPLVQRTQQEVELILDQEEFDDMVSLKCLDDKDISFLSSMNNLPLVECSKKMKERMTKLRNKVKNLKRADKFRPVDLKEVMEKEKRQRESALRIEKHTLYIKSLSQSQLMLPLVGSKCCLGEYNYGVRPQPNENFELYRERVINAIKILGEEEYLSKHVE